MDTIDEYIRKLIMHSNAVSCDDSKACLSIEGVLPDGNIWAVQYLPIHRYVVTIHGSNSRSRTKIIHVSNALIDDTDYSKQLIDALDTVVTLYKSLQ